MQEMAVEVGMAVMLLEVAVCILKRMAVEALDI